MTLRSWIQKLISPVAHSRRRRTLDPRPRNRCRPGVEVLENRLAPALLTVTTKGDDVTPNDGTVSLREAITAINAGNNLGDPDIIAENPGTFGTNDTIVFSPSLAGQTITLTIGGLTLSRSMTINGLGADQLTVSGNNASRVFEIAAGQVTISGLRVINGKAFYGAGIDMTNAAAGTVGTLIGLDIESNRATGGLNFGGGIRVGFGTLNLINSTVANNYSGNYGAGIEAFDSKLTITNSTIANNTTKNLGVFPGGSGLAVFGTSTAPSNVSLESSTLSGNLVTSNTQAADLYVRSIDGSTQTITLHNTILNAAAANPVGTPNATTFNAGATITSLGHNISSDGTGNLTGPGDLPNTNPLLDGFGFHGGATPTIPTLFNSPAIDNGDPNGGAPKVDQRGAIRGATSGFGGMANAGILPDIGAVEQSSLYVVTSSDATTTPLGYDTSSVGTLRGGVEWANGSLNVLVPNTTPNVIMFDTTGTFATPQTITLHLGTLSLTNTSVPESIVGTGVTGPSALTVSGNNNFTVFTVNPSVTATISGMTITNGNGIAGGVLNRGALALTNVTISNSYGGGGGGGVANIASGNLTLTNSTISKNSSPFGGGIFNTATLVINSSTLSGNNAVVGSALQQEVGSATITDSTITGNTGSAAVLLPSGGTVGLYNSTLALNPGGGLQNTGGTLKTHDTILAGNTGFDVSGNIGSLGHNLIQNPAGGSGFAASDIQNVNPRLGPLAFNGGPTQTMALGFALSGDAGFPNNPAVDSGDNNGAPVTDQRGPGWARIINGIIDIGAFEDQLVSTAGSSGQTTVEGSTQSFNLGSFNDAAPGVSSWSATVIWGDGSPNTPLTLNSQGGIPNQTHIFADEGTYTVTVQVSDAKGDTGQKTFTVSVTDPNVVATGNFPITAVENNLTATQTVATFTDPAGAEANDGTHYSASINWGDSTTATTGTISFAGGTFTVSGNHTYADEGTFTITVTINHEATTPQSVTDTVTVSNPNVAATAGFSFSAAENAALGTKVLATFTDAGGPESLADYSASINWGDGTTPVAGSISLNGSTFSVSGNHTYADEGTFTITVTINHENTTPQTVTDTATISNPNVVATGNFSFTAAEGSTSSAQTVATFTDPGGTGEPSDYSASINWGDGSAATAGSITLTGTTFTVSGSHLYGEEGSAVIQVTINHEGTTQQTATSSATISDPAVVGTALADTATAGAPFFNQAVATFTDPGGAEPNPSDSSGTINNHYQIVSINWGDGSALDMSSGSLSYSGGAASKTAAFTVSGNHTYAANGTYTLVANISHEGVTTPVSETVSVGSLGLFFQGNVQTKTSSFWASIVGQELLRRFGLTAGNQTLGQWLASTFPKLYGGVGGAINLGSLTNAQIGTYYLGLFHQFNTNQMDASVLSACLYEFATTLSLGGPVAGTAPYGLTVNTFGMGAYSFNIGFNGAAFGVPNFTVLDVFQILQAANNFAVSGEPWGTNTMLRNEGLSVFRPINGDAQQP